MSITICCLVLILGFGTLTAKLWTLLPGHGASITTGFVRHLTLFHGCWNTWGLAEREVLWSSRYGVLLRSGHFSLWTAFIWRILSKIGWTSPLWRRLFALVATALVCLAERILTLGFWLFVLISGLRGFFFNVGFCTSNRGWCSLCSSASVWKVALYHYYYYYYYLFIFLFSISLLRSDVWGQWVASWQPVGGLRKLLLHLL